MGTHSHAGKTKPQLLCGTTALDYSGPWPCPPTRGQHLTRSRGFVCGWMGTPLGRPIQTVKWDSCWPVSHPLLPVNLEGCWLSPRTEVREVIIPGDEDVQSKRARVAWVPMQITIWPSWNYPACWFCYRDCRVGWYYLGEYQVFWLRQEALGPKRTHISVDRMNLLL